VSGAEEPKGGLFGPGSVENGSGGGGLFGAGVAVTRSEIVRPTDTTASGLLFGGGASVGTPHQTSPSSGIAAPQASTEIDESDPGKATQIRAQFERRGIKEERENEFEAPPAPALASAQPRSRASAPPLFGAGRGSVGQDGVSGAEEPKGGLFGPGSVENGSGGGGLFGAGVAVTRSEIVRPTDTTASGLLFGGGASVGTPHQTSPSSGIAAPQASTEIDESDPGKATQIRAQFERRVIKEEITRQRSWAPKMTSVPLPDGNSTTTVHARGSEGGLYGKKVAFTRPPPEKKSLSDLP